MSTIVNINPGTFGGPARMGDIVGICNVIQFQRNVKFGDPNLKFHMKPGTINESQHCQQFYSYMLENTDYFSKESGVLDLKWNRVNIWDYRAITGDLVFIPSKENVVNKVVMFPLFDAPYNTYRNWPVEVFYEKLRQYFETFTDWERVICIADERLLPPGDYSNYTISTDFLTNLQHIKTCRRFIGGDTGTSHFAWSLAGGPESLVYVMSNRSLVHTLPFHLMQGKGKYEPYWLDFEGTTWN